MKYEYKNPVCRGCWGLGNNCGTCERCVETRPGALAPPPRDSTSVPANDSTLALKNADSGELRARVLKALWAALVANDTVDAMAAFVQSERQQAAEEAYERSAQVADRYPVGCGSEPLPTLIRALKLTGGA